MKISIHSLLDGAQRATGTVAVIDVFRAFTTAAVALANGASEVIMVGTVEEALALREKGIGDICMGEVGGKPPPENPKISTIRHLSVTQPSRDVPAERMLISGKRPMCVEICITFDQYLKRR